MQSLSYADVFFQVTSMMSLSYAEKQFKLPTLTRAAISISDDASQALSVCRLNLFQ